MRCALIGCPIAFLWTIAMVTLSNYGVLTIVWLVNGAYHDAYVGPYQSIRIGVLVACIMGSAVCYTIALATLIKAR